MGPGALSRVQKTELQQITSGLAEVRRAAAWTLSKSSAAAGGTRQAKVSWNAFSPVKAKWSLLVHSWRWSQAFIAQGSPLTAMLNSVSELNRPGGGGKALVLAFPPSPSGLGIKPTHQASAIPLTGAPALSLCVSNLCLRKLELRS